MKSPSEQTPWVIGSISLKYGVSDMVFYRRKFVAMQRTDHFSCMPIDGFQTIPEPQQLASNVDVVLLRSLPVSCPPERLVRLGGYLRYVPQYYRRYYVDLSDSFESYLQRFSSKSRSTLLRKVKKFSALPGARWQSYYSSSELLEFIETARQVSMKTYQHKLLDAGLPESQQFRDHVATLGQSHAAVGAILFVASDPVAYVFCPAKDNVLLYEYVGFDPTARDLSPGTVLQYYLLQELFANHRFRIFDFTEGEGQHKAFFATHNVQCADVYFFRRSAMNMVAVLSHSALSSISSGLGKLAAKFGVKAAVKRFLRQ